MTDANEFIGRASEMRDSQWLACEDIEHVGDVKVIIERTLKYTDVKFATGPAKARVFALQLKGKTRQLIVNGKNRAKLAKMFGQDVTKWKGNEITIGVRPDKQSPTGKGIRVL